MSDAPRPTSPSHVAADVEARRRNASRCRKTPRLPRISGSSSTSSKAFFVLDGIPRPALKSPARTGYEQVHIQLSSMEKHSNVYATQEWLPTALPTRCQQVDSLYRLSGCTLINVLFPLFVTCCGVRRR